MQFLNGLQNMEISPGAKAVLIFGRQFSPKQQYLYLQPFPWENKPTPGEVSCSNTADYCIQKETWDTFPLDTQRPVRSTLKDY